MDEEKIRAVPRHADGRVVWCTIYPTDAYRTAHAHRVCASCRAIEIAVRSTPSLRAAIEAEQHARATWLRYLVAVVERAAPDRVEQLCMIADAAHVAQMQAPCGMIAVEPTE